MRWGILLGLICVAPVHSQTAPQQFRLVEELRIGAADGPQSLTDVRGLTVSPDGKYLYVMQQRESAVRMFDAATGRPVRSIGRAGSGPGEFRVAWSMGWIGDTLFVYDMGQVRVSRFSSAGDHLRTDRLVAPVLPETRRPVFPIAFTPNGDFVGEPSLHAMDVANGVVTSLPWLLIGPDGKILRRLAAINAEGTITKAPVGDMVALLRQPMAFDTYLKADPVGRSIVVVRQPMRGEATGSFRVSRFWHDGRTAYSRSYRYTPRAVSAQLTRKIYAENAERLAAGTTPARAREAARQYTVLPRTMPPVSGLIVGADGSAWLRREETGGPSVGWLVLDPNGGIRATVQAPAGAEIKHVHGNSVWGVVKDDLDIPYVVRYRTQR